MRIPSPSVRKRARIEIIPLIDIIFFLLATFVMVSLSMVKTQGIHVNLPSAITSAPQKESSTVTITIADTGKIYLNKEEISADDLLIRLRMLKEQAPETGVIINGDEKAFFGDAVAVLDKIRGIGISKVTIQTKGESNTRR